MDIDGGPHDDAVTDTPTVAGDVPGDHTLGVELVKDDLSSHDPAVVDEVPIRLE